MTKTSSILLLGHTGFVGRNVIEHLTEEGWKVAGASRSTGHDLRDAAVVEELVRMHRPGAIVNCAAQVGSLHYVTRHAAEVISSNARLIAALYDGIAQSGGKPLVINPVANCAYPGSATTLAEDLLRGGPVHHSVLSFGESRRLLCTASECFRMQYGIRSINLLVPNMYGPHDSTDPDKAHALNALAFKFVNAAVTKAPRVEVWGTGAAVREWLFAPDFARIVGIILGTKNLLGLDEPLNVAQNFGLSVRELVGLIQDAAGYEGEVFFNADWPDGAPRKVMDDSRFRKVFPGFEFTPLPDGISRTVESLKGRVPPDGAAT